MSETSTKNLNNTAENIFITNNDNFLKETVVCLVFIW